MKTAGKRGAATHLEGVVFPVADVLGFINEGESAWVKQEGEEE